MQGGAGVEVFASKTRTVHPFLSLRDGTRELDCISGSYMVGRGLRNTCLAVESRSSKDSAVFPSQASQVMNL